VILLFLRIVNTLCAIKLTVKDTYDIILVYFFEGGRKVTVRTPNFIISECERLIEALPCEYKHKADKILQQLQKPNKLEDIIWIMDYMVYLEEACGELSMQPQLFKRSLVSLSLIKAFEKYGKDEETEEMLKVIQQMANFARNWGEQDENYNWDRTFNVVLSITEWRRICARAEVLPNKGNIQIALQIKKPKKLKIAEKAWKELSCKEKLKHKHAKEYFDIWFRQVDRALYYIYLP